MPRTNNNPSIGNQNWLNNPAPQLPPQVTAPTSSSTNYTAGASAGTPRTLETQLRALTIAPAAPKSADYCINKLRSNREVIEKLVKKFPTCDVKAQAVLKFIRGNKELWQEFHEKLEVRSIRVKEEGKKIVLHPQDEPKERWRGVYHVYVTVRHEDKRLVIDPYIAGENSCAHMDEHDFLKWKWQGKEGKEYVLETVVPAPLHEDYRDEEGLPNHSIEDFIDNFFDPDTVPLHKFYAS